MYVDVKNATVLEKLGINLDNLIPQQQSAETHVNVIDRICGAGKTYSMIESLDPMRNYVIITPLLDDIATLIKQANKRDGINLVQPEAQPTKSKHIMALLYDRADIVCSHELYKDLAHAAREGLLTGYDIIIDEVLQTTDIVTQRVEGKGGKADRLKMSTWKNLYIRDGYAEIAENGLVTPTHKWSGDLEVVSEYLDRGLHNYAEAGCLWSYGDTVLVWELPAILMSVGRSMTLMTYRFEGSLLSHWMRKHDIQYTVKVDAEEDARLRARAKSLITISAIAGAPQTKYGIANMQQLNAYKPARDRMFKALRNLKLRELKGVPNENLLVTCLKSNWYKDGAGPKDVREGEKPIPGILCKNARNTTGLFTGTNWCASVTRGTNAYDHCSHVLYIHDQHINPSVARSLEMQPSKETDNLYAISEMVQFIFRSRIRKGEPITVYMPSKRMRELLEQWLDGDI